VLAAWLAIETLRSPVQMLDKFCLMHRFESVFYVMSSLYLKPSEGIVLLGEVEWGAVSSSSSSSSVLHALVLSLFDDELCEVVLSVETVCRGSPALVELLYVLVELGLVEADSLGSETVLLDEVVELEYAVEVGSRERRRVGEVQTFGLFEEEPDVVVHAGVLGRRRWDPIGQHLSLFHLVTWHIHDHIVIPRILHTIFQRNIGVHHHQRVERSLFRFVTHTRLRASLYRVQHMSTIYQHIISMLHKQIDTRRERLDKVWRDSMNLR